MGPPVSASGTGTESRSRHTLYIPAGCGIRCDQDVQKRRKQDFSHFLHFLSLPHGLPGIIFFKFLFLTRILLKVITESVTVLLLFYVLIFWPGCLWKSCFLTSDPAPPGSAGQFLTNGSPGESPIRSSPSLARCY